MVYAFQSDLFIFFYYLLFKYNIIWEWYFFNIKTTMWVNQNSQKTRTTCCVNHQTLHDMKYILMLKQHWLECVSSQASDVAVSIIFYFDFPGTFFVFARTRCCHTLEFSNRSTKWKGQNMIEFTISIRLYTFIHLWFILMFWFLLTLMHLIYNVFSFFTL